MGTPVQVGGPEQPVPGSDHPLDGCRCFAPGGGKPGGQDDGAGTGDKRERRVGGGLEPFAFATGAAFSAVATSGLFSGGSLSKG